MPKLRILALHSFRMSGSILRKQLMHFSNLGQTMLDDDLVELEYLDGVHQCTAEDEAKMEAGLKVIFAGERFYEWLNADPDPGGDANLRWYKYIDQSVAKIVAHVQQNGPYDGFLGFSQGGTVAHLLSLLAANGKLACPAPRFLILLSCRQTRHAAHKPLVEAARAAPLAVPVFVMWNGWDDHVFPEETTELLTTLKAPTTMPMEHVRGHKIPPVTPDEGRRLRAFLEAIPALRHDLPTSLRLGVMRCLRSCCLVDEGEEQPMNGNNLGARRGAAAGAGTSNVPLV